MHASQASERKPAFLMCFLLARPYLHEFFLIRFRLCHLNEFIQTNHFHLHYVLLQQKVAIHNTSLHQKNGANGNLRPHLIDVLVTLTLSNLPGSSTFPFQDPPSFGYKFPHPARSGARMYHLLLETLTRLDLHCPRLLNCNHPPSPPSHSSPTLQPHHKDSQYQQLNKTLLGSALRQITN
jgi:hypothetical protein